MSEPRKDGVAGPWPRVDAAGWDEAVALGGVVTEPTTFEWSDGCAHFSLTMGFQKEDGSGPLVINVRGGSCEASTQNDPEHW